MAALAIKKPYPDEQDIVSVDDEYLENLVGVYDFADSSTRIITLEDNHLYSQRTGSSKFKLFPIKGNTFFLENSFATIQFKDSGNEIEAIFTNRIDKTKGVKTTKPIPVHTEIRLGEEILNRYTGVFELTPNFYITITLENGKLMSQATGQDKFEIFAESQTKFFLKVVDAQIEFIQNDNGNFDSFILYQGGQEIPGKKKD